MTAAVKKCKIEYEMLNMPILCMNKYITVNIFNECLPCKFLLMVFYYCIIKQYIEVFLFLFLLLRTLQSKYARLMGNPKDIP